MRPNTINPFLLGNSDEIAKRIIEMMPKGPEMTPEQAAAFEKEREEGRARYQEARYGTLPVDTYRVLDYGCIAGWYYSLEIDGKEIVLQEPGESFQSRYSVHDDSKRAIQLARSEVGNRYGFEAAERAKFSVVWGGTL